MRYEATCYQFVGQYEGIIYKLQLVQMLSFHWNLLGMREEHRYNPCQDLQSNQYHCGEHRSIQ